MRSGTMKGVATGAALTLMLAGASPVGAREVEVPEGRRSRAVECEDAPFLVVAQFLRLAPEQLQAVARLLQERQATLAPILQGIAERESLIRELIASGGDPEQIGTLVVEIHLLRQQAESAQASFLAGFESVLGPEQRVRWEQVRVSARLQAVLPAFLALQAL